MIPCFYYYYFGIECFGCGFQRSLISLVQLDLVTSFRFFPGMIPLLGYFLLEIIRLLKVKWSWLDKAIFVCGIGALMIQILNYMLRILGVIPWAHEITCSY
jgi:hypothetical protein